MASKKTVKVDAILEYANIQLRRTDDIANKSFKSGICLMIEHVLKNASAYNGFCHLDADDCELETLGYYSRQYFKI